MSPAVAGLSVMVLAIAMNVSAGVYGVILPRMTHYKVPTLIGLLISMAALCILAGRASNVSLLEFEILLVVIGIGFGGLPPLSSTVLQNSVSIHTFGTAVATMQFSRNLYCTMMVAAFGAIVLTGPLEVGAATAIGYSAEGFVRIFYAAAASFALALVAIVLVEAKPLADQPRLRSARTAICDSLKTPKAPYHPRAPVQVRERPPCHRTASARASSRAFSLGLCSPRAW